jgi:hypothetical protein
MLGDRFVLTSASYDVDEEQIAAKEAAEMRSVPTVAAVRRRRRIALLRS